MYSNRAGLDGGASNTLWEKDKSQLGNKNAQGNKLRHIKGVSVPVLHGITFKLSLNHKATSAIVPDIACETKITKNFV